MSGDDEDDLDEFSSDDIDNEDGEEGAIQEPAISHANLVPSMPIKKQH